MTEDQTIRFECLKIAAQFAPGRDPRQRAEALFEYIKRGDLLEKRESAAAEASADPLPSEAVA